MTCKGLGLSEKLFDEQTQHLINHYSRVLQETERHEDDLQKLVSRAYIERMKKGLRHWIDGGKNGHLAWGVFVFVKE